MDVAVSRLNVLMADEWCCMWTLSHALSVCRDSHQHELIQRILPGFTEIYLELQQIIRVFGFEHGERLSSYVPPDAVKHSLDDKLKLLESMQKNIIAQIDALLVELVDEAASELLAAIRQFHVDCVRWLRAALR